MVQRHSAFNLTQAKDYKPALVVKKTADEVVNNNNTPQNDDDLFFAVGANEVWAFTILLMATSSAGAGLHFFPWSPAGSVVNWGHCGYLDDGVTLAYQPGLSLACKGWDARALYVIQGVIVNGATAGNFQLRWSQYTAEVSDTTVHQNSCIIAHRLA